MNEPLPETSGPVPPAANAPIEPLPKGTLGSWWRQGFRSAFFLKPQWAGLRTTPVVVLCLVLAPYLLGLLVDRLYIEGPADFYWQAIGYGWLTLVVSAWVCWLLGSREQGDAAPSSAALFSMLAAQSFTLTAVIALVNVPLTRSGSFNVQALGRWGVWAVWILPIAWAVSAQLWMLATHTTRRHAVRILASLCVMGATALTVWADSVRFWYAARPAEGEKGPEPLALTQELLELQPKLLADQLRQLEPQRPGKVDVYTIAFAPYAEEDVFMRESDMVAGVMRQRFDAEGRTLQLVNNRQTVRRWAWATPLNLQRAIQRMASLMNRDEDVLFIHLTSHGAREGSLAASFWPLEIESVTPQTLKAWLDEAGVRYRIVSISACYSGSWIAPLASDDTLLMTAADADHTSYGCGRLSELTFFGRAMYDEQLRHTWSFEQAHAAARKVIERRETEAGKSDGYSNPQISIGPAMRSQLSKLEAQFAARQGG